MRRLPWAHVGSSLNPLVGQVPAAVPQNPDDYESLRTRLLQCDVGALAALASRRQKDLPAEDANTLLAVRGPC